MNVTFTLIDNKWVGYYKIFTIKFDCSLSGDPKSASNFFEVLINSRQLKGVSLEREEGFTNFDLHNYGITIFMDSSQEGKSKVLTFSKA